MKHGGRAYAQRAHGTVTLLFTDIEGSFMLLQRLGDRRYAEILAKHQRLLRDVFAKGNGQEIDTQGDAFLVAFARARDAVATAVAAQQALTKHAWPSGTSLRVRMGLIGNFLILVPPPW